MTSEALTAFKDLSHYEFCSPLLLVAEMKNVVSYCLGFKIQKMSDETECNCSTLNKAKCSSESSNFLNENM